MRSRVEDCSSMETTVCRIAGELGVGEDQIEAVVRLLSEGATVPFLARYRKEATGGLDRARLRAVEDHLQQVRELDERRSFILKTIGEQGRLCLLYTSPSPRD